jgi:hypothetical protein
MLAQESKRKGNMNRKLHEEVGQVRKLMTEIQTDYANQPMATWNWARLFTVLVELERRMNQVECWLRMLLIETAKDAEL